MPSFFDLYPRPRLFTTMAQLRRVPPALSSLFLLLLLPRLLFPPGWSVAPFSIPPRPFCLSGVCRPLSVPDAPIWYLSASGPARVWPCCDAHQPRPAFEFHDVKVAKKLWTGCRLHHAILLNMIRIIIYIETLAVPLIKGRLQGKPGSRDDCQSPDCPAHFASDR